MQHFEFVSSFSFLDDFQIFLTVTDNQWDYAGLTQSGPKTCMLFIYYINIMVIKDFKFILIKYI